MRTIPFLLLAFTLTACDLVDSASSKADAASRAPISSRERSLIYAADGAAQQGNYPAAERDYLGAIAENSGHIDAHLGLAQLYLKNLQTDKALPLLEKALELEPDHAFANYLTGKLYLDANRYEDAASAFDRGLTSQPDNLDLATGKGITLDMQGNHRAAQMQYLRGIKTNPKASLTKIRTNLAMSYLLSGEPKKAVDLLKDEGNKADAPSVTRHNLALAYGLLGQHAQAKKLIHGEMDEATRQVTIARMRDYVSEHGNNPGETKPKASISSEGDAEEPVAKPAPKKVVKPKPKPAADAATSAPTTPANTVSKQAATGATPTPPATSGTVTPKPASDAAASVVKKPVSEVVAKPVKTDGTPTP